MTEQEGKDFKKFLTSFTNPFLDEIKQTLKMDFLEIPFVTECLQIIHTNMKIISYEVNLKNHNFTDRACEIAEFAIRR